MSYQITLEICVDSLESAIGYGSSISHFPHTPTLIPNPIKRRIKWGRQAGSEPMYSYTRLRVVIWCQICGSLMSGGGVTPSVGLVHSIRHKYATIPIHVRLLVYVE
jgi:hypothetical protein